MTSPNITASWQTLLADLSLILFMLTASAVTNAPDVPVVKAAPVKPLPPLAPKPATPSQRAEPVGVWIDSEGAPPLAAWLAEQARDPRLRATIVVRFAGGDRAGALLRAARLSEAAGPRGAGARIVIEAGAQDAASVALGYDDEIAG